MRWLTLLFLLSIPACAQSPFKVNGLIDTTLTPGTSAICANGTGGLMTNVGCVSSGLPFGADWLYAYAYGIKCDAVQRSVSITSGSNTVTIGAVSVGQTLFIGDQTGLTYGAPQYTWFPTIVSQVGTTNTLSGNAPFTYTGNVLIGTDNTAAFTTAFATANYVFPLRLPAGCTALTQTVTWPGTSLLGQGMSSSQIAGVPGQDILQAVGGGADETGVEIKDVSLNVNSSIDPARGPYTSYDPTGVTPTVIQPFDRPVLGSTQDANTPLSDQWVTGGSNGVAATTQSSAVICVPTALGRTPANGSTVVFPYLPTFFTTTVLNQTGGGCAGGNVGVTLNAALPSGSSYTVAQAYWEAGTAFETGNTTVCPGGTCTYPLAITVTLPTAPDPAGTMAGHGHLILGNAAGARLEVDYMGNNYNATPGSGQITLRKGPASSAQLTGGAYFIIPANPCYAEFETPYPVIPNLNGGSAVTPAGAVYFPGACVGNAAISFPEPDGTTPSTGTVNAYFQNIFFANTPGSRQQGNSGTAFYMQGNTAGYSDTLDALKIGGLEYGIVQGPASKNNWGISSVGPTAAGNTISNCEIHAAFPIILTYFSQGAINRCDTYTSMVNPYDGSTQGAATAIAMSYTLNEQTGGGVTNCFEDSIRDWNSEPEGGSPQVEVMVYADLRCANGTYDQDNFEGAFSIFGGNNQIVRNSYMSLPVINYGTSNRFEHIFGLNGGGGYFSNQWATNTFQFFNWGVLSSCSGEWGVQSGSMGCGVGFTQSYEGHDMGSSYFGNDAVQQFENQLGGQLKPGERNGLFGHTFDATEPYWGQYDQCTITGARKHRMHDIRAERIQWKHVDWPA